MRPVDRNPFRLRAVVIALVLVAGGAVAFFTFVAPKHLAGPMPLGIDAQEVKALARWLDRDRPASTAPDLPVYTLPAGPVPLRWAETELHNGARSGRVRVRTGDGGAGAIEMTTTDDGLLGPDPHIVLRPATTGDIRRKYLQVLAQELGLLTPDIAFVQVQRDGRAELFRREPVPGADWTARHGVLDAVPFRKGFDATRPDHLRPVVQADAGRAGMLADRLAGLCPGGVPAAVAVLQEQVDVDAVAAWLLMLHLEGGPNPMARTHPFYYREATGRIVPVYAHAEGHAPATGPTACDPFTPMLADPAFHVRLQAHREHLLDVRGRLRERFAALDQALLPRLAGEGSIRLAQARAGAIADTLLDRRLGAPLAGLALAGEPVPPWGWAALLGDAAPAMATIGDDDGAALAEIRRRYWVAMHGDTIVFRRAKYRLDEDLVLPAGHPVLMLSGARFEIGPGRSLVCQGPLEVRATSLNPVFVRAAGGAPFGAVAVRAPGAEVRMQGLRMSGGAGGTVNGTELPAMLCIEGAARTEMADCHLDMEHAGDALLVDGGRLVLTGGRATGGRVLLRRVQGRVAGTELHAAGRPPARVGLHAAGGRLVVDSVRLAGYTDVALLAADGAQLLVTGSAFTGNATAVRCGDMSAVHVDASHFERNGRAFHVPLPGGEDPAGRFVLYTNTFIGNDREQDAEAPGSVERRTGLDAAVRSAFGVR